MHRVAFAIAAVLLSVAATPAGAQAVITNPGWCAQFYPNANCQNLGPGNPYTSAMVGQRALPRAPHIGPIAITATGAATDRLRP